MEIKNKFTPLVSVAIPCFNHASYVVECIDSVIRQDYKNIELIVIDDGSSDSSIDAIRSMTLKCEARFVRYKFIARKNRGLSATLNEALAWGQGKYFSAIASDDSMLPTKTSELVKYLEQNQSCAAVLGGVNFINNDGNIYGKVIPKNSLIKFNDIFLLRKYLLAPAVLMNREILQSIGGFNEGVKVEDWELWLRLLAMNQEIHTINKVVSLYRRHENNISKNVLLLNDEMKKIAEIYVDHPNYKKLISRLNCIKFRYLGLTDKRAAVKMTPILYSSYNDPRLYQGIFNLVFRWNVKGKKEKANLLTPP